MIPGLHAIYIDQLQDLYTADVQTLAVSRRLAQITDETTLAHALRRAVAACDESLAVLEEIITRFGCEPEHELYEGVEALLLALSKEALEEQVPDRQGRRALIVALHQRMAHYGMAGYLWAISFARRIGEETDAENLQGAYLAMTQADQTLARLVYPKEDYSASRVIP